MPRRSSSTLLLAAVLGLVLALPACGSDDEGRSAGLPAPTSPAGATPSTSSTPTSRPGSVGSTTSTSTTPATADDPLVLGQYALALVGAALRSTLPAWSARYTATDGTRPTFTWKGKQLADGSFQASLVIAPPAGARRKATWTMRVPLTAATTAAQTSRPELAEVAVAKDREARRLARLPRAKPADSGPIKLVVQLSGAGLGSDSGYAVKPIGGNRPEARMLAVDDDGNLDEDLLRGFDLLGDAPAATQRVAFASVTRFARREAESSRGAFLQYVRQVGSVVVTLAFEDDARRPATVEDLLRRPPLEVRSVNR